MNASHAVGRILRMAAALTTHSVDLPPMFTDIDNAPVVRLREYLTQAKIEHADFRTAWQRGRVRAVHGLSAIERRQWLQVLDETQEEWSACYHNTHATAPQKAALRRLTGFDDVT